MKRLQTAQHVFAALALALAGWEHLKRAHGVLLPSLEIAAAALLVGAAVRERFRRAHDPVGWVEIAGGFMTLVEAIQRTRERHHLSFMVLSFLQPVVLFAFGIFDVQLAAMRYLEANDDAFVVRLRPLFRRRLPWRGARAFRFRGTTLEVETERGLRKFRLKNVINFEPAKAWTVEQFRRRGVLPAEELPGGDQ
ncbi:MAG TPA: hypothetical protein VG323_09555 [Thermoanaerobaculia bacterium]|nr:hypothetical protein [Thermoanaerobaculia bacterium]